MDDKKLAKLEKILGKETIQELEAMPKDALDGVILNAAKAMEDVQAELEANPAYVTARENLKDLTAGKREVNKRQKALTQYALALQKVGS